MAAAQLSDGQIRRRAGQFTRRLSQIQVTLHLAGNFVGLGEQAGLVLAPVPDDLLQQVQKFVAWIIGSAEKSFAVRREKRRHRPAAAPAENLDGGHVDLVDIRPLFAVYLDRNKVGVQIFRHRFVFKAFVLHHMTPVTGGITDGQKNGFVLPLGPGESLRPPGIPVHRVVCVLQQVR